MPRPGPRPYECVRRAWHSERHQPMRGSLIKEIFRIAHEIHSPSTKRNKEWQEKLPIVVLKAEEIMYSKANSEAEYMDPKTLWGRVNDAIDTIIRRDGSDETGELLQPCIEAALNLGCIPRRASRSDRNTNPRFYLGSYSLGRGDGAVKPASPHTSQCPNFLNTTMLNSKIPVKDPPHNCDLNILPVLHPSCHVTYSPPLGTMDNAAPCDKEFSTMKIEEKSSEELVCDLSLRLAPLSVSAPRPCPEHETRKRRAMEVVDDQQFSWQPKLLCAYSAGSAKFAGL